MRAAFKDYKSRVRSSSISAAAPPSDHPSYNRDMARAAASILYLSPLPSPSGHPIYILNATALPDTTEVDYDTLLPYVLARLPGEEDLISGAEYEVVFFAGGAAEGASRHARNTPGVGWFIQAYHVLSRAMRKRIQRLYIVHERKWVRVLVEVLGAIASPKFRRKIVHASSLTELSKSIDITNLLIPPSAYLRDRELSADIHVANASGRRAFSARPPLPRNVDGTSRLPRVLRETSLFILLHLQTEGLFRIPPHIKLKEIVREAYDRGQKYIVWKERGVHLPLHHFENELPQVDVDVLAQELDQSETYGIHLAAGVLKFWYSELREPIFPSTCYKDLRSLFGNTDEPISREKLTELLSLKAEWSILPVASREILLRHLLPLLSAIAARSDENKMTPDNLAVCFAPTLCCGPDQLEDAKASSVIRRVLTAAVEQWADGLREACGIDADAFSKDLRAPTRSEDYEDPVPVGSSAKRSSWRAGSKDEQDDDRPTSKDGFTGEQESGILLRDNDLPSPTFASDEKRGPPLPPRQQPPPALPPRSTHTSTDIRRKEVPALDTSLPPRYSVAIRDSALDEGVTESPSTYITPANGFAPARRGDWSFDASPTVGGIGRQEGEVRRKPVGSGGVTPVSAAGSVDGDGGEREGKF